MTSEQAARAALPYFMTVAQFCAHFAIGHTKAYELLKSGAITAKMSTPALACLII